MDILIDISDDYFVLINLNARDEVLESIPDQSIASIFSAFRSIFKKLQIKSLESDEEAAFVSKPELKYLKEKNIDYSLVTYQSHNNLTIID
jgi:hypothetical protein